MQTGCKYKLVAFFLLWIVTKTVARSQSTNHDIELTRQSTLKTLRSFRNEVNAYPAAKDFNGLINNLTSVIEMVKTSNDQKQLLLIEKYFEKSESILDSALDREDKMIIAEHLNDDISMKLSYRGDSSLSLETASSFGNPKDVFVKASIDGVILQNGTFRLYWAVFRGKDQNAIILSNNYDGNSNLFVNPFKVSINLPGFVTFWIQDATHQTLYKSDVPYKRMEPGDTQLEINFIKLN